MNHSDVDLLFKLSLVHTHFHEGTLEEGDDVGGVPGVVVTPCQRYPFVETEKRLPDRSIVRDGDEAVVDQIAHLHWNTRQGPVNQGLELFISDLYHRGSPKGAHGDRVSEVS